MSQAAKVALVLELVSGKGQAGSPPTSTRFPSMIDAPFTCYSGNFYRHGVSMASVTCL